MTLLSVPGNSELPTSPRVVVLNICDRNDRNTQLARVLVKRTEQRKTIQQSAPSQDQLIEASITLSYELIAHRSDQRKKGNFTAQYNAINNEVSLTAGALFMDIDELQGHRIGTYLMHVIVLWAKQWPDAMVKSVSLHKEQGVGDNKIRRNKLYENIGLRFTYNAAGHQASGRSYEMPVESLEVVRSWEENITELSLADALAEGEAIRLTLTQEQRVNQRLTQDIKQAELHPVRWAVRRLWVQYSFAVMATVGVSFLVLLSVLRHSGG